MLAITVPVGEKVFIDGPCIINITRTRGEKVEIALDMDPATTAIRGELGIVHTMDLKTMHSLPKNAMKPKGFPSHRILCTKCRRALAFCSCTPHPES